ncbi:hypothetical protein EKO29_03390 [Colwellia sp. Arc7-635]|uniref:superoxide dismutase family protein n=1 Tax=Colwellia sp. Arc7-635 TaxID=2497879 RepID=UPI000F8592FA|nr:superoxide dismutase family protein [Colwellia sp. Arc7-635]AZQ83183.1 hypothetical protein EKO29_03390 [Colwellia sp. Arc7-635]
MNFFRISFVIIIFLSNTTFADIINVSPEDIIKNSSNETVNEQQFLQDLSSKIEELLAKKKNIQAIELAKTSALQAPQSVKTQFFYVSLLVFLEEKQQALQQLSILKERFPNNGKAFFMSSVLQWQEGKSELAIADMVTATALSPSELKYWLMLSQMNHDGEGHGLNVHKGSLEALLSAEQYHENNTDLLYRIAATYDEESKSPQALSYYAKVLTIMPEHNDANIASAINTLKMDPNADVSRWQENTKSNVYRLYIKGVKLVYQGDFEQALQTLQSIQSELTNNGHLDYYLAKAKLELHHNSQAVNFANSAISKGVFPSEQNELIKLIASSKAASITFPMHRISLQGLDESIGSIDIIELSKGIVIKPTLSGLASGSHGFHVHQEGTCDNVIVDGKNVAGGMAKGHYMGHQHHGSPAGDLPNIVFDKQYVAKEAFFAPQLTLDEVKGRSFMIHALATKDANLRIACGVAK